jgi:hypothetical protein
MSLVPCRSYRLLQSVIPSLSAAVFAHAAAERMHGVGTSGL